MQGRTHKTRRTIGAAIAGMLLAAALAVPGASPAQAFGSSEPPPIPSVSAGGYITCGVQTDGTAACWGENGVPANDVANVHPGEAATPPDGLRFLEVNAGYATGCGVKTDRSLVCWGSGRFEKFRVPGGQFKHVVPGLNYVCALRMDDTIACWGGDVLDPDKTFLAGIPSGAFTQLSIGNRHACGLRPDGTIACWGFSLTDGQANVPNNVPGTYKYVNVSNFTSCALRNDGSPLCWGRNQGGQQTYPAGATFTQLSTGFAHVCGLRPDRTVLCWGRNLEGQSSPVPPGTYTHVSAGTFHTCAIPESGPPARCWGNNMSGRVQPNMSNTPPQDGYVGTPYSYQFTMNPSTISGAGVIAHVSPAPQFTLVDGEMPPGLTLAPNGILTGTPVTAGSYSLKVAASNGLSPSDCSVPLIGSQSMPCRPGDPNSVATATRSFTVNIAAEAPEPGSISGRVTTATTGAPVDGATVKIAYSGGSPAGQTTTDSDGYYIVAGLFPGDYRVTASGAELQPQTKSASVSSNRTTPVDFALGPLVRPTVLAVSNNHWQTLTDGVFVEWSEPFEQRLDDPAGYTVHARSDCGDPAIATGLRGNWLQERPNSTSPTVPSRIRDLEMRGYDDVVVGATYYLRVAAGTEFGSNSRQRNALACVRFVAELRPQDRSAIAGRVTSAATGGHIAGATVTVTRTTGVPGTVVGVGTTDTDGNYRIENLPPSSYPLGGYTGSYNVTVSAPGRVSRTSSATTFPGGTANLNFSLKAVPVARNDSYTQFGSDTTLVVGAPGVMGNDFDEDGDSMTASLVDGSDAGTVTINSDGSFTYQANEDFVGSDSFTYKLNDGEAESEPATVTINVRAGCRGVAATIMGTSGNDKLTGTSGRDVIAGLAGNDHIRAAGGNDVVCAGSGNDSINLDVGDDYADAGSGEDVLRGDHGGDHLIGAAGADTLLGDDGDDFFSGGTGTPDSCRGGSGEDALAPDHGCERLSDIP